MEDKGRPRVQTEGCPTMGPGCLYSLTALIYGFNKLLVNKPLEHRKIDSKTLFQSTAYWCKLPLEPMSACIRLKCTPSNGTKHSQTNPKKTNFPFPAAAQPHSH